MSNATKFPIQFNNPKTIWTLSLLLLYTILSMIPFYYYLTNLVNIDNDGIYFLQYLPIFMVFERDLFDCAAVFLALEK